MGKSILCLNKYFKQNGLIAASYKRITTVFLLFTLIILLISCSTTPTPKGLLYTHTKGPVFGTSNSENTKMGKASAVSILGVFCTGDVSIENIARQNGISKIHHVDYEDFSVFFGAYQEYTVYVYGE